MVPVDGEVGIDFSLGELHLLCEITALPVPPVLAEAPWERHGPETADLLRAAGLAALVARHVLDSSKGAARVNPAVVAVLEVLCLPKAVIRVCRTTEGRERRRFVAAVEKAAVEQVELRDNVIRLMPMVATDLVERVIEFAHPGLAEQAAGSMTIPRSVLEACARNANVGDIGGAAGDLEAAGLVPEVAAALSEAIADPSSTVLIEVSREAGPEGSLVSEMGWVETSEGPWAVSLAQAGDEHLSCSPVAQHVVAEWLIAALPESIGAGIARPT